jgi:hypothetical protein
LTAEEVGVLLSLHPDTVRKAPRLGELVPVHVGKRKSDLEPTEIDRWKQAHMKQAE